LKLKKVVFTGSPADEVIEPYQSALLSFWNNTEVFGKYDMIQLKDQEMYLKDTFGIRTMVLDGRASFISVENVWHNDWIEKADLIEKYVLPYLD
jgi:palmitoyl-protein thioesterase